MCRIHRILALGLGTVFALLGPIAATAQETVVSAFIRSGECAKPGMVVANLTPATLPDGPAVGNTAAPVAVQSFTVAPVASAAIFGAP
ncbi:MAG: hypothetical protein IT337_15350, partial [Thermomicrobiales bacterium]|nr:hypothetical protein [Thermomicrobiales bacterium]